MAAVLHALGDFQLFPLETGAYDPETGMSSLQTPSADFYPSSLAYELVGYNSEGQEQYARQSKYGGSKVFPNSFTPRISETMSPGSFRQPYDQTPSMLSSASGNSAQSSSIDDSPDLPMVNVSPQCVQWADSLGGLVGDHSQVSQGASIGDDLTAAGMADDLPYDDSKYQAFVDPSLIHHFNTQSMRLDGRCRAPSTFYHPEQHLASHEVDSSSPTNSEPANRGNFHTMPDGKYGAGSPSMHNRRFRPNLQDRQARRPSITSLNSRISVESLSPGSLDEDSREKSHCHDCGRLFKDLKAHMLTHQSERPEKCPISTCSYHVKGFARKYDKNRHTLTHYKGTMVCGFCPGSGSSTEKSFNRADVFKRHLTSLHGVEQTPPNSRRKSPNSASTQRSISEKGDVTGICSTCSATFDNAQDFYEHLDDCVLRVVQQEEPSEAINERILNAINDDQNVKDTLDRHLLPSEIDMSHNDPSASEGDDFEGDDEEAVDEHLEGDNRKETPRNMKSGKGNIISKQREPHQQGGHSHVGAGKGVSKNERLINPNRKGLTVSKGGVPLVGKCRRRRKHYPASWGCSAEQMKMKKRVLCVYDGARRLWKDDMMLGNEFEVRMRINDGKSYVTDLDVETVKRAEAFHAATDEEKGPWAGMDIHDNTIDIERLMS